uniref:Uncharacterized protein n=1 Tax=Anguilla anguilla TaxID=7936 RepID=A0A0E9VHR7_ANGAN
MKDTDCVKNCLSAIVQEISCLS